jgi:hypothetical protein
LIGTDDIFSMRGGGATRYRGVSSSMGARSPERRD